MFRNTRNIVPKFFNTPIRFLAIVAALAILLTACKSTGNSSNTTINNLSSSTAAGSSAAGGSGSSTPAPSPASGSSSVSRLSEVLDPVKYANQFTVRMFNVENKDSKGKVSAGDTILLISPDGKTMLIDSGFKDSIPGIIAQIKKLGITKLDYIVATHMHADHIGGFPEVLFSLPVEKVLMSNYTDFEFVTSKALMNAIKEKNKKIDYIKEGDTFQFGKDIKVEVLSPEGSDVGFDGDHFSNQDLVNEQSVVLKMTYGNTSFIFAGDIQIGTEMRLVEKYGDKLDVDVIKVPHHGYGTSSGIAFLNSLSPKISLINNCALTSSVIDTYQRYQSVGSKVYVPGLDGIILAASDGKNVSITTEKDRKPGLKP